MNLIKLLFQSKEDRFLEAAVNGNSAAVTKMLQTRPELLETADGNGRTALYFSVANGHTRLATALISLGANVNPPHCSPLYRAVEAKRLQLVSVLLEAGADPNFVAGDGTVPLFPAIERKNADLVRMLLQAKGKPSSAALHFALHHAANAAEKLQYWRNSYRNSRSDIAASNIEEWEAKQRPFLEIAHLLVDAGADLRTTSRAHQNNGITVLHHAGDIGDMKIARQAIEQGVDVNVQDEWGKSALGSAAARGDTEMCKFLLDKGADINIERYIRTPSGKEGTGVTPVVMALLAGHADVVELLVKPGANVSLTDRTKSGSVQTMVDKLPTPDKERVLRVIGT